MNPPARGDTIGGVTSAPETSVERAVQRRAVRVLSASQALGGIGVATGVAVSTLVAASISGSDAFGGLAATAVVLTESVPVAVRPDVQGLSDLAMNTGGALGGVLAGVAVAVTSYPALAVAVVVLVLPFLAITVSVSVRTRPA